MRPAEDADLPAILELVRCCDDGPRWGESVWRDFAQAKSMGAGFRLLLLAEGDDGVLRGLLAATSAAGQTELESVLVVPAARRGGLGRRLTLDWLAWAEAGKATVALLEVRASNDGALAFYRSLGFIAEGRRPGYYRNPVEDAILMGRQVGLG